MNAPRATARLQVHGSFTLEDAAGVADHYAALGISHLYLSPVFAARKGSTHGYDVTDPTTVNPEIGGMRALEDLAARVRALDMGIILDIVPNHMAAVSPENGWWADVLRHGRSSAHAATFDIDWQRPPLPGKVLLPILGKPYGQALAAGEIQLARNSANGAFSIRCAEQVLPLSPESEARLRAEAGGDCPVPAPALHRLLEEQHYRLAWWRTAADDINWRRFFEISELVGVRVEDPNVFEMTHSLIFRLYGQGMIDGVRIDHIDGLADPAGYLARLRRRLAEAGAERPGPATVPYVIVEKILAGDERLRASWDTDGTTGYDFMDEVSAVLHDASGEEPLTRLWESVAPGSNALPPMLADARCAILTVNLASEFAALSALVKRLADADLDTRDFSLVVIRRVLGALLVSWRVYRTYYHGGEMAAEDAAILEEAVLRARGNLQPADHPALDVLVSRLFTPGAVPEAEALRLEAVTRLQQLTSPLAAKSLEDTVFYRYGRLLSRNEVGSDPAVFRHSPEEFHRRMTLRMREHPHSLLATATHDHKRGEDARARLAVLSELPDLWKEFATAALAGTRQGESRGMDGPDAIDHYMLLQTLVAAWPPGLTVADRQGVESLLERVAAWQVKALRESKRRSTWVCPDSAYEEACGQYLKHLAAVAAEPGSLLRRTERLVADIAPAGAVNSLSQTLLRLTVPGVPDLYQDAEGWDFSMVDPDNRRPVDYARLRRQLADGRSWDRLRDSWRDGGIKQRLIARGLEFRKRHPLLFSRGEYVPLAVEGGRGRHGLAFMRRYRDEWAVVIVSRLTAELLGDADTPLVPPEAWGDTAVRLPGECAGSWREIVSGSCLAVKRDMAGDGILPLREALFRSPVALLGREDPATFID